MSLWSTKIHDFNNSLEKECDCAASCRDALEIRLPQISRFAEAGILHPESPRAISRAEGGVLFNMSLLWAVYCYSVSYVESHFDAWNCFRRSCYCPYPCGNSYIFHKKAIIQNVVGQESLFLLSITGLVGASQCEYIVRCLSLDKVGTFCLETFDAIGTKWKKGKLSMCASAIYTCILCRNPHW